MSKLGQKEAVIAEILVHLPNFQQQVDNAILLLSPTQLEAIKTAISAGILAGTIEYGKDATNIVEVFSYARSMVMNHLKKAKELNGGVNKTNVSAGVKRSPAKYKSSLKGINPDLLTDELKEFVKTLV